MLDTGLKKSRQKLNILRTKRAFKLKINAFFIILEDLSLRQIKKKRESHFKFKKAQYPRSEVLK